MHSYIIIHYDFVAWWMRRPQHVGWVRREGDIFTKHLLSLTPVDFKIKRQNAPARVIVGKRIFQNAEEPLKQDVQIYSPYFNRKMWDARQFLSGENLSNERLNPGDWTNHHARAPSVWRVHRAAVALSTRLPPFLSWIQAAATFVTRTAAQRSLSSSRTSAPARAKVLQRESGGCWCHIHNIRSPLVRGARLVVVGRKIVPREWQQTFLAFQSRDLPFMARLMTGTCGWIFRRPLHEAAAVSSA